MSCVPDVYPVLQCILLCFCSVITGSSTTISPCGGPLVAVNKLQLVQSLNYPSPTKQGDTCNWTIDTGDITSTVLLTIVDLDIEAGDGCGADSVKVYDGSNSTGQLLATWCGQMSGDYTESTGSTLTVVYTVISKNNGRGFSAHYTRQSVAEIPCQPYLEAKDTYSYLTSPRYPQNYPSGLNCIYIFVASRGELKIEFLNTDLPPEVNGTCTSDYVTVYDGTDTEGLELKSVNSRKSTSCGTDKPVYVSSDSDLTMTFSTNTSESYKGFRLRFKQGNFSDEYKPPCGGVLTAIDVVQTFTSPHYPNDYPEYITCVWTIHATDSTKNIRLTGSNINITEGYSSRYCGGDELKIFDGNASSLSLMTRLCGFHSTLAHQTFSNVMTVLFSTSYSSKSTTASGFSLQYIQTNEPLQCNFRYEAENYRYLYATTPGYPNQYRTNHTCTWTIDRTEGSTLVVEFTDTNITNSVNCSMDYVNVYDGHSAISPQIGRFCGTQTPTFKSNGPNIFMEFVSGPEMNGNGLRFRFDSSSFVEELCDTIENNAGREAKYITSTHYPFMYPRNAACQWRLSTDANSIIVLEIVMSDIEESQGCTNDWVEIYDGYYNNAPMLAKWCGSNTTTYRSTGDNLFIVLRSNDNNVTGRGFRLKYSTEDKPDADSVNVGAIVGGVIGGIAAIALITVVVFLVVFKLFLTRATSGSVIYTPNRKDAYL